MSSSIEALFSLPNHMAALQGWLGISTFEIAEIGGNEKKRRQLIGSIWSALFLRSQGLNEEIIKGVSILVDHFFSIVKDSPIEIDVLNIITNDLNLKTAVGDANLTQSLEPESFAVGRSFTNRECPAPLQSDSNSRSCANLASRTAVSRLNNCKKEKPLHPKTPPIDQPDKKGFTRLQRALDVGGNCALVSALLDMGASVNAKGHCYNPPPLLLAAMNGRVDEAILLINANAPITYECKVGTLHEIILGLLSLPKNCNVTVDILTVEHQNQTLLDLAIKAKNAKGVKTLLGCYSVLQKCFFKTLSNPLAVTFLIECAYDEMRALLSRVKTPILSEDEQLHLLPFYSVEKRKPFLSSLTKEKKEQIVGRQVHSVRYGGDKMQVTIKDFFQRCSVQFAPELEHRPQTVTSAFDELPLSSSIVAACDDELATHYLLSFMRVLNPRQQEILIQTLSIESLQKFIKEENRELQTTYLSFATDEQKVGVIPSLTHLLPSCHKKKKKIKSLNTLAARESTLLQNFNLLRYLKDLYSAIARQSSVIKLFIDTIDSKYQEFSEAYQEVQAKKGSLLKKNVSKGEAISHYFDMVTCQMMKMPYTDKGTNHYTLDLSTWKRMERHPITNESLQFQENIKGTKIYVIGNGGQVVREISCNQSLKEEIQSFMIKP